MQDKKTGAYYTPKILSDFLVKHINELIDQNNINILEPSCGDGIFVDSISQFLNRENVEIDICDTNQNELNKTFKKAKEYNSFNKISKFNGDYLKKENKKYSLIIGNPPYISKKTLPEDQIDLCKEIIQKEIKLYGEVKNIWPAFLIKSTTELKENGVICFVLPSELLQVKYTKLIREYLLIKFNHIEIFAFNELIFEGIEQDVVVFIGQKKDVEGSQTEVSFFQVEKLEDLTIPDFVKKNANTSRKKLSKWTNYILDEKELNFIEKSIEDYKLKSIMEFCSKAEVGIVTGANKYFILKNSQVEKLQLQQNVERIISKGSSFNSIILTKEDINEISRRDLPISLIVSREEKIPKALQKYLDKGIYEEINKSYKTRIRKKWYDVPSLWASDAFFLKRCHLFPKVIINEAGALCTDSFYRINIKDEYSIENFTFCFYNTLSFILAELEGRFYGGGVLELTPSEFKSLYIPYVKIDEHQINKLNQMFKTKKKITEILDFTDNICFPNISSEELSLMRSIWVKLVNRRTKNDSLSN